MKDKTELDYAAGLWVLSRSTMHITVSGIRYFYENILKRSSIIAYSPGQYLFIDRKKPEPVNEGAVNRIFWQEYYGQ
ncbi:MAG: hypothetical protein KAX05_06665 [Bacteroidales bacterium]|nr:hypothetical protein [Bacteroidales bacterium]